jgi:hypothetical protein
MKSEGLCVINIPFMNYVPQNAAADKTPIEASIETKQQEVTGMKKNQFLRLVYVASLLALLGTSLFAATIKKKNGEVLEGKILGMIVQKSGQKSSVTYTIRKGSDVVAIDERGVTFKKGSKVELLLVHMEGKSVEEIENLGGAGGVVIRISGNTDNTLDSSPVLGEYTGSLERKEVKGVIVGSIRIQTKSGTVTIPIEEIVEFGEKKARL